MIELDESIEGEHVESNDFYFKKIGEPVPIKPSDSVFDLEDLPAQPLAVSERFYVVCVAHSTGFCVARTKDVVTSAKEMKDKGSGSSILGLSIVDVPVGRVHILAFSADNSMLAASVSGNIHIFSTTSLLNKEREPSFSCTLNDRGCVKDLKWTTKSENSYLVLSNDHKLYHGLPDGPLKNVMNDVDAVEWSTKGNSIAVARGKNISILSSRFKERFSMSLLESHTGVSNVSCTIKVDSMKWVRADCIILGCFQVTDAGAEEDYLIQIIRSKDGKLADASSERVVLSFNDVFLGLVDDILPISTGPYLFLSYVEKGSLAIMANKKNTDQHVVLLGWSLGAENGEVAVIEIERDTLLPRIELQENGDDNLVLGLCTDKFSVNEKIEVQLGAGELTELSPFCILMCLTLEGKLVMFHVASVKEYETSPEIVSALSDEEEGIPEQPIVPTESRKPELEEKRVHNQLQESNNGTFKRTIDLKPSRADESTIFPSAANKTSNVESRNKFASVVSFSQPSNSSFPEKSLQGSNDFSKSVLKFAVHGSNSLSTVGEILADNSNQSRPENQQKNVQEIRDSITNTGTSGFQNGSEWYGGTLAFSKEANSRPSPLSSKLSQSSKVENPDHDFGTNKVSPEFSGKTFLAKNASSNAVNPSGMPFQVKGSLTSAALSTQTQGLPTPGTTKIESLPNVHGSHISLQENFPLEKSEHNHMPHPLKIKQMSKELDMLLESIEKPGGFVDACTTFQKHSLEALEKGLEDLSVKSQTWNCTMDERLHEIQNLLDNTFQVVAKKLYMEGIVKQASDSRYWELWDRQKLSCELEMKQQHIVKMNNDMTNQLIALEKHFNSLELNNFGENGGARDERSFQSKCGFSSHGRSLHTLHNTMRSQLAAAELLSDCLLKQMEALSIKAPSIDKRNVKKELFETIGIPYDASFSSPDLKRVSHVTPNNRLSSLSDFSSSNSAFKRSNARKDHKTETARRRRDSLDQNLVSFETIKTTIQRKSLLENQRTTGRRSFLNKQHTSSLNVEGEVVARRADSTNPSVLMSLSEMPAIDKSSQRQRSEKSATNLAQPSVTAEKKSQLLERNKIVPFSLSPGSQYLNPTQQNSRSEAYEANGEKSSTGKSLFEKSSPVEIVSQPSSKSFPDLERSLDRKPSIFTMPSSPLQATSVSRISDMSNFNRKESVFPALSSGNVNSFFEAKDSLAESAKELESHKTDSSGSVLPEKLPQIDLRRDKRQPDESLMPSTFSLSRPSPYSTVKTNSASSSNSTTAGSDSKTSITGSSGVSSPLVSGSGSFTFQAHKPLLFSPSPVPQSSPASDSPKKELQLRSTIDAEISKQEANSETKSLTGIVNLKPAVPSGLSGAESLTMPVSRSLVSSQEIASSTPNVTSISQPQQQQPSGIFSQVQNSSSEIVAAAKGEQDDSMDEEAPETNNTSELNLGSLGGFGISPTTIPPAPKSNPFGGSFGNAAIPSMSSPFSMTVPSGELFRPASFSFQSPLSSQSSQPTSSITLSGGFGSGVTGQSANQGGFGQPSQIGPGLQALGSVLGNFGQSRQLGQTPQVTNSGSSPGFGGGFAGMKLVGGFSNAAQGGGFAGVASGGGGFAGMASSGGGFSGLASGGGGFAANASPGGGFAGVTGGGGFPATGGGFGAFSSTPQATGGFSAFGGGGGGGSGTPPELFTQMRK